jgi:hypothetical protein
MGRNMEIYLMGRNIQSFIAAAMRLLFIRNLQKRYLTYRGRGTLQTRY